MSNNIPEWRPVTEWGDAKSRLVLCLGWDGAIRLAEVSRIPTPMISYFLEIPDPPTLKPIILEDKGNGQEGTGDDN